MDLCAVEKLKDQFELDRSAVARYTVAFSEIVFSLVPPAIRHALRKLHEFIFSEFISVNYIT